MIALTKLNRLIDEGFSVLFADDAKRPIGSWKTLQQVAYTKEQLEQAYSNPKNALAGIITGYNNLEVIDIDLKVFSSLSEQNEFWNEYLQFLKDNIDDFDKKFVIYKTKNKGYHILYRCQKLAGNCKIAKVKDHKEAVIESRGIGGYVVIYENNISKLTYTEIQEISEEDRDILWSVSRTYNYVEDIKPLEPKSEILNEVTPWQAYNAKHSIFDVIGLDFKIVADLKDKYIIKRYGGESPHSGYVYKDKNCMYLFSTATIYPHEKLISPFSAYTFKEHNGDFKASASKLYHDGYGTRRKSEIIERSKEIVADYEPLVYNTDDLIFPIDIFPLPLQAYMNECSKTLDASIDYMGCSMLWLSSVIIGNSIQVEVKAGWRENVTLWMAIVGKAGLGKTPSINNIIFPLLKANSKQIKDYIKKSEKFNEYNELNKDEKKQHEKVSKPTKTQFIANDITLEALVDLHQESKNAVGVFKDELAGWLKDMNKYRAGSDLEFWLSTWSGKSVSLNRMSRAGSFVENPLIPVLGGIQPSIFNTFYTDENKENGFMDRMLLSYPDLVIESYNDKEISESKIQWYSDSILSFYESIKANVVKYSDDGEIIPNVAKFSEEAKTEWKRIFNEITEIQNDDNENEYMKSMLPKQKSYIPRFALLIDVMDKFFSDDISDSSMIISQQSVLKAEKLSKYFIATAKKIKSNSTKVNEYKSIIGLNKGKNKKQQFLELYKANPDVDIKEVALLLNVSVQSVYNYLKQIK